MDAPFLFFHFVSGWNLFPTPVDLSFLLATLVTLLNQYNKANEPNVTCFLSLSFNASGCLQSFLCSSSCDCANLYESVRICANLCESMRICANLCVVRLCESV